MEKPVKINNVLIAQAGGGTNQIGRFDITIDDNTNSIIDYKWKLIRIDNRIAKPDRHLTGFINSFKTVVDQKYAALLCKLGRKLTHPIRTEETTLGNLFADAFAELSPADIVLVGSGSIRSDSLGPLVTLKDVMTCFPYDDSLNRFEITGAQVWKMFERFMRPENRDGEGENYQVNSRIRAVYNDKTRTLESLSFDGQPIVLDKFYTVCLQGYHVKNSMDYLNISNEELSATGKAKVISTSAQEVFEEYLRDHQNLTRNIEGRMVYKKA